jgi:hypothetical protein
MRVGEISKFILTAEYAYGSQGCKGTGMAPDILPGDSLIFEIELLSTSPEDNSLTVAELKLKNEKERLEETKKLREAKHKEAQDKKAEKIRQQEERKAAQLKKKDAKDRKGRNKKKSSDDVDIDSLDKKSIKKMKPNDLKNVLKKMGLSIQGNKKELIKRLEATLSK